MTLKVTRPTLTQGPAGTEVRAEVDGFPLWFRLPVDCPASTRGDTFAPIGLVAAMAAGQALDIEGSLSPRLFAEMNSRIQSILTQWNPDLKSVEVRGPVEAAAPVRDGVASFFSGGVDSSYTFLRRRDEVTHLVLIDGYDYRLENEALAAQARRGLHEFAAAHGRTAVVVQTNLRGLYEPRVIDALLYHGPMLAAVALLLGFPRTYIPATHTFLELMPWGSHALLDPLWSTEATEIVHDGAEASRTDKVAAIADSPEVGRTLRVCFQNGADYNCGTCEKCLRTRLALRLVGKRVSTLAPLDSVKPVSKLRVADEAMLAFFEDNYARARAVGDHEAAVAVRACIRRFVLRTAFKDLDRLVLGGGVRRLYQRISRWLPGREPPRFRFSVRGYGR